MTSLPENRLCARRRPWTRRLAVVLAAGLALAPASALRAELPARVPGPLRGDLVAYWNFGDVTKEGVIANRAPLGGAKLDARLQGGGLGDGIDLVAGRPGSAGRALRFSQSHRYARVDAPVLAATAQGYAYAVWFCPDALNTGTNRMTILESFAPPPDNKKFGWTLSLEINSDNQLRASAELANNWAGYAVSTDTPPVLKAGAWHLAVATVSLEYPAHVVRLWLDGRQVAEGVLRNAADLKPTAGLNFGTYRDANGRWFRGAIQEAALWDRPLSDAEVRLLVRSFTQP